MITEKNIQDVKKLILEAEDPDKIIIFGSYGRGLATEASDLDVLVIKNTVLPLSQRTRKIRRCLANQPFPKDILVLTPNEFERWSDIPFSFNSTVRREGRIVYER